MENDDPANDDAARADHTSVLDHAAAVAQPPPANPADETREERVAKAFEAEKRSCYHRYCSGG